MSTGRSMHAAAFAARKYVHPVPDRRGNGHSYQPGSFTVAWNACFLPPSSAVTLTIEVDVAGAGLGFPSSWPPGLSLPPGASCLAGFGPGR